MTTNKGKATSAGSSTVGNGRYILEGKIGSGAFAEVYRARCIGEAGLFAIKRTSDETGKRVLRWEAANLQRLRGAPFVPPMREYWIEADGCACLVTPFLDSGDLKHYVRAKGGLDEREALTILTRVAEALTFAHALQPPLVHRDIKPDNILGHADEAGVLHWFLADWGLAESWQNHHAPRFSGTSRYTAPEVWKKRRYLVSDVYSLGMTFYFMLFGQPAYNGTSAMVTRGQRAPEPVVIPEGCPEGLKELLAGLLAKNHVKRWPLAKALEQMRCRLGGLPALGTNRTPEAHPQVWTARHRGFSMEFVWIPPGGFVMGLHAADADHADRVMQASEQRCTPRHAVRVDGFWMARFPVTRGQFRFFVRDSGYKTTADRDGWANPYVSESGRCERREGSNWERPGFEQTDEHPVVNVSHDDALEFAEWLSWRCHRLVRLPTEAEWERACRAGGETRFHGGEVITSQEANFAGQQGGTTAVGCYPPNAWGVYDLHGNAHEWVRDWFATDFYARSPQDNPYCDEKAAGERVLRGGSWLSPDWRVRSGARDRYHPGRSDGDIGFRLSALAYPWENRKI
ncbi:MAG: SUMF1/EgtB/PvdO family nonheme iron enzyme [Magnetococcales bacterium]|nr:SUMF1/EgtB/PvdO family nonheme iron enzyme [Magnetococcales bacterium]